MSYHAWHRCGIFSCLWIVFLLSLSSCGDSSPPPTPPFESSFYPNLTPPPSTQALDQKMFPGTKIKIGALLPLSHPELGEMALSMQRAAELAILDHGQNRFELVIQDTGTTPESGLNAAQLLIPQGVQSVIGPFHATTTRLMAPLIFEQSIHDFTFSNDLAVAHRQIHVMGFTPEEEVQKILLYAYQKNLRQMGILAPNTSYGQKAVAAAEATLASLGIQPVFVEHYVKGQDPKHWVEIIKDQPIQALLIPDGGDSLNWVLSYVGFYNVGLPKVQLLGTKLWDQPSTMAEPASLGAWFTSYDDAGWQFFNQRYYQTFGINANRFDSMAYDAVSLIILASDAQGQISEPVLFQATGFEGVDGLMRLRPDGSIERGLSIYQMGDRDKVLLVPAPKRF